MKKKINFVITIMIFSAILGTNLGIVSADNTTKNESRELPAMLEPIDNGTITMRKNDKLLFKTTQGDYFKNEEYYNKKFGLGKHFREGYEIIEPKGIEYNPHKTAVIKNFPKVFIDKNGNSINNK